MDQLHKTLRSMSDTQVQAEIINAERGDRHLFDVVSAEIHAAATTEKARRARNKIASANRRNRDSAMRDLGMVKVRGSQGGTFWE